MSVRTVNVFCPGSEAFSFWNLLEKMASSGSYGSVVAYGEAPAFYQSVTVRHWGSGTRSKDLTGPDRTRTQEIDYDESMTFSRVPIAGGASYASREVYPGLVVDHFTPAAPGAGECHIGIAQPFLRPGVPHMGRHYLVLRFDGFRDGVNVGTDTIDYDDPGEEDEVNDLLSGFPFRPWHWEFSAGHSGDLGDPYDQAIVETAGPVPDVGNLVALPITAISNWRDIRGTYSVDFADSDVDPSWDSNSITHHTSITIA